MWQKVTAVRNVCFPRDLAPPVQVTVEKELKGWVWFFILKWGLNSKNFSITFIFKLITGSAKITAFVGGDSVRLLRGQVPVSSSREWTFPGHSKIVVWSRIQCDLYTFFSACLFCAWDFWTSFFGSLLFPFLFFLGLCKKVKKSQEYMLWIWC